MGTRTNIHFNQGKTLAANIYRHYDGYPGKVVGGEMAEYGVLSDLLVFFKELKANVPDNRFGDPHYLAAKFVVWQAKLNARDYKGRDDEGKEVWLEKHYLDFLSLGVCVEDIGWIEYIYEIDCSKQDLEGFPVVRWKPVPYGDEKPKRWRNVYLGGKPPAKPKTKAKAKAA